MQTRTLAQQQVGAIGLGLMTFDQTGTQPRQQLVDTVSAALDAGVTLFDTADAYGPGEEKGAGAQGENERLIVSILDELGARDRVLLATKGGHVRTEGGGWDVDSSAAHLHRAVAGVGDSEGLRGEAGIEIQVGHACRGDDFSGNHAGGIEY